MNPVLISWGRSCWGAGEGGAGEGGAGDGGAEPRRRRSEAGWCVVLPEVSGPEERGITRIMTADDDGLSRPGRLAQDRLHPLLIRAAEHREDDILEHPLQVACQAGCRAQQP